ncbi:MAG: PEGA domain-containing protein [Planctomycetota bacterium]|nr:PEGA domain-containing protein [Planctomycetota bacterium]
MHIRLFLTNVAVLAATVFVSQPAHAMDVETARIGIREVSATAGAIAQAAADGTSADLVRLSEAITVQLSATLSKAGAGTVIAREEMATILREQSLAASGLIDSMDPATAKRFKIAGVDSLVTTTITGFTEVIEELEVEGRFGKTTAQRRTVKVDGVARVFNTTSGRLISSAMFDVSQNGVDEIISGTKRNTSPLSRVLDNTAASVSDSIAKEMASMMKSYEAAHPGSFGAATAPTAPTTPTSTTTTSKDHTPSVLLITRVTASDLGANASTAWRASAASALSGVGFRVILAEDSISSMIPTEFDLLVASRSSITNLAQSASADGVLVVGLDTLDKTTKQLNDPSAPASSITEWTLGGHWRLMDTSGLSVGGQLFEESETVAQSETLTISSNPINALVRRCAQSVAKSASSAVNSLQAPIASTLVHIEPFAVDLGVPDMRFDDDGVIHFTTQSLQVIPVGCTVLIDGIARNNAPGDVSLAAGLHRIRLEHPFFDPWEQMVKCEPGITIRPAMKLTAAVWTQWESRIAFTQGVKRVEQDRIESSLDRAAARAILEKNADATLKMAEGLAQFLKQSKMTIDTSSVETLISTPPRGFDLWADLFTNP